MVEKTHVIAAVILVYAALALDAQRRCENQQELLSLQKSVMKLVNGTAFLAAAGYLGVVVYNSRVDPDKQINLNRM